MRTAGVIAMSLLVAACSQSVGGEAEPSRSLGPSPSASSTGASPAPQSPSGAPLAGAPVDEVITWIEKGSPADPAAYHVAFRDGVTTRLGEGIAFVAPAGPPHSTTQCITEAQAGAGPLICLLDLASPPPRPEQAEGMWKPGWIEFTGDGLSVGSLRGDPGPFANGTGTELAEGQTLMFGDNRCRSDRSGLFCVNYAHRSAVRIAADGVAPFGCLTKIAPPPETALLYSC
jgi:hypothetical protein